MSKGDRMNLEKKTRDWLLRRLTWIGENCEPNDPADRVYWKEYKWITKQLGITEAVKKHRDENRTLHRTTINRKELKT